MEDFMFRKENYQIFSTGINFENGTGSHYKMTLRYAHLSPKHKMAAINFFKFKRI